MTIKDRIKEILKEKKVTQEALGDALNVTKQAINYRLVNDKIDSVEFILAISQITGVNVEWIFFGGHEDLKYIHAKELLEQNKKLELDLERHKKALDRAENELRDYESKES